MNSKLFECLKLSFTAFEPYSVLKICHSKKAFCTKNYVEILTSKIISNFFLLKAETHMYVQYIIAYSLLRLFEISRIKTNSVLELQSWKNILDLYAPMGFGRF